MNNQAMSPTEKAYRPSHRASIQDAIMHDASYYSLVEIKGPEMLLVTMLEISCDPQGPGPGSLRYVNILPVSLFD
jgi:ribonuclease P/MRP protein subunit POP1